MLNPYFTLYLCSSFLVIRTGRSRKRSGDQITLPTTVDFSSVPKQVSVCFACILCSAQSLNLLTWTFCKPLNKGYNPFFFLNLEHQYLNSCASPAVKWIAKKAIKVRCFISWSLPLRLCNYVKAAGCTISKFCPLWCVKVIAS